MATERPRRRPAGTGEYASQMGFTALLAGWAGKEAETWSPGLGIVVSTGIMAVVPIVLKLVRDRMGMTLAERASKSEEWRRLGLLLCCIPLVHCASYRQQLEDMEPAQHLARSLVVARLVVQAGEVVYQDRVPTDYERLYIADIVQGAREVRRVAIGVARYCAEERVTSGQAECSRSGELLAAVGEIGGAVDAGIAISERHRDFSAANEAPPELGDADEPRDAQAILERAAAIAPQLVSPARVAVVELRRYRTQPVAMADLERLDSQITAVEEILLARLRE